MAAFDPLRTFEANVSLYPRGGGMDDVYSHWRYAKEKVWASYEDCSPFKEMGQAAAAVASEQDLSKDEFADRLYEIQEAYSSFLHATNSGSDSSKWRHWHNRFQTARLGKKFGDPYLSSEMLSSAAFEYLKSGIRVPKFDRALLDALVAQELFAFIDTRAGRSAFGTQFGCFGFIVVVVLGWQMLSGEAINWNRVLIGLAIFLVPWALVFFWPRRGFFKLYLAMRDAYHLLSGSVVSVPELRRAVEKARDEGVVWPPELYAVLDDVEARTQRL
jgi:hypothetical protein